MRTGLKQIVRDVTASLLYKSGVTRPENRARLSIVTFHRVLPAEELAEYPIPDIAVTPEELAWFLEFFGAHFEVGTLEQMHERWNAGAEFEKPPLAITFDDGQLDNFRHARPVLNRARVRASFFVPTDAIETGRLLWHDRAGYAMHAWLKQDEAAARRVLDDLGLGRAPTSELAALFVVRIKALTEAERRALVEDIEARTGHPGPPAWDGMMNFDQLLTLAREEHEIGSHSHTHPILTQIPVAQAAEELSLSRAILEQKLGRTVTSLCYPNGDTDEAVARAARRAGYRRAVTTRWGWNPRGADPLELTRCDIQACSSRSRSGELSAPRLAWRLSGLYPGVGVN